MVSSRISSQSLGFPLTRQTAFVVSRTPSSALLSRARVQVGPIAPSESPTALKGLLLPAESRPSKAVYTQRRRYRTGLNSLASCARSERLFAAREKTQTHGLYLATTESWLQADYRSDFREPLGISRNAIRTIPQRTRSNGCKSIRNGRDRRGRG